MRKTASPTFVIPTVLEKVSNAFKTEFVGHELGRLQTLLHEIENMRPVIVRIVPECRIPRSLDPHFFSQKLTEQVLLYANICKSVAQQTNLAATSNIVYGYTIPLVLPVPSKTLSNICP